jgi:hypothetical protein
MRLNFEDMLTTNINVHIPSYTLSVEEGKVEHRYKDILVQLNESLDVCRDFEDFFRVVGV